MDSATVASLATVAGAAAFVAVLLQLILNTLQLDSATQDRFGPLMAVGLGILVTVVASFTIGTHASQDLVQAVVNGILAGLSAIGLHGVVTKSAGVGKG